MAAWHADLRTKACLLEEDDLVGRQPEEAVLLKVRLCCGVGAAAGHQVQPQRVPMGRQITNDTRQFPVQILGISLCSWRAQPS